MPAIGNPPPRVKVRGRGGGGDARDVELLIIVIRRASSRDIAAGRWTIALVAASALFGVAMLDAERSSEGGRDDRPPVTSHALRSEGGERGEASAVTVVLRAHDERSGVAKTEYRIDGGRWRRYRAPKQVLFDGTQTSFDRWRHVGPGSFVLMPDGSMQTEGGLGMLWYPVEEFRNISLELEWRDARTDSCCSNSGVFLRFPDPEEAVTAPHVPYECQVGPALTQAEWVAIYCGHEFQINDGTADPQATGSVYNFKERDLEQARPNEQGDWNAYEIRTEGAGDYEVTIVRNGELINLWANTPGQQAARPGDPPTDDRQWPRGYVGLQNHGASDIVEFRNVVVRSLSPKAAAFTVTGAGRHTLEYRSVDFAGNIETTRRAAFRI
jgi:hypothetical protein